MHILISGDLGITIGNLTIPYYGGFILLGITAGCLLALYQSARYRIEFDDMILLACFSAIGALLGAKMLYLMVSFDHIDFSRLLDPAYFSSLLGSGFVFYGGLIGALLGACVAWRFLHLNVRLLANIMAPCIALGHAWGRIGCLFAGCCFGMPANGPLTVTYDHSLIAPNGIELIPVQLIEAVGELFIATILLVYLNRLEGRHGIAVYLALYAPLRFILECFRYDDVERGIYAGLSTSQWISVVLMAGAVGYLLFSRYRANKTESENPLVMERVDID